MTEGEWLGCPDPTPMLEYLRDKASERKLRLFACACCRQASNVLTDKHARKALTTAERYADAEVSEEKLGYAWGNARRAARQGSRRPRGETVETTAMWAVSELCQVNLGSVLGAVGLAAQCAAYPHDGPRLAVARKKQISFLRDIIGNPFRPVIVASEWRAWNDGTALKIAQAIYGDRAFDHLPILADALEDAGCDNADILAHCRGEGPHFRGCWVVDLLLGKD